MLNVEIEANYMDEYVINACECFNEVWLLDWIDSNVRFCNCESEY